MLWLGLAPDELYDGLESPGPERWPYLNDLDEIPPEPRKSPIRAKGITNSTEMQQNTETTGTVRPLRAAKSTKPKTEEPKSFNDVTGFADRYSSGNAVLVRLGGVEHGIARRIIDFASGLCYIEKGTMQRIGNQEYLLIPKDLTVSKEMIEQIKEEIKSD